MVARSKQRLLGLHFRLASVLHTSGAHHVLYRLVRKIRTSAATPKSADPRAFRINRPDVEETAEKVLRRPDLYDISAYYSRSPASGFWILEYSDRIIGLIAVDASLDATSDGPVAQPVSEQQIKKLLHGKGTAPVAVIRHFFIEEAYRPADVEEDLLRYAVGAAFEAEQKVSEVRALGSPLRPSVEKSLCASGFTRKERVRTTGILRWDTNWYMLERKQWQAQEEVGARSVVVEDTKHKTVIATTETP